MNNIKIVARYLLLAILSPLIISAYIGFTLCISIPKFIIEFALHNNLEWQGFALEVVDIVFGLIFACLMMIGVAIFFDQFIYT